MPKNMKQVRVKIEITEIKSGKEYKRDFVDWIDEDTKIEEMLEFFENGE